MRTLFLILLFVVNSQAEESVRVRLFSEKSGRIEIAGVIHRLQGFEKNFQTVALPQKQNLILDRRDGRWVGVGSTFATLIFPQPAIVVEGENLFINGHRAPPKIILAAGKKNIDVIGIVPLEKYVMGVLAHEMPAQWPLETLKAQAVAARSYALAVAHERMGKAVQLESSVLDQVYGFLTDQEFRDRFDQVTEAVTSTAGKVLMNSKNKVLKSYYHADCGGQTASSLEAWTTKDELVSVQDSFCPQNPGATWELSLSPNEMTRRLKDLSKDPQETVTSIKLKSQASRKRVAEVEIQWDSGNKKTIPASHFRKAIGFFDLKSTQFSVGLQKDAWHFKGLGFGHGVGLCQWGSKYLGKQGWEFEKILAHYYPKARLAGPAVREKLVADGFKNQIPL